MCPTYLFVLCMCVCARARTHARPQTGLACLWQIDAAYGLGPEFDERRGCSLKFHHLPLDAFVDPLCCGSLHTMSHQLTCADGERQPARRKYLPQSDLSLTSLGSAAPPRFASRRQSFTKGESVAAAAVAGRDPAGGRSSGFPLLSEES